MHFCVNEFDVDVNDSIFSGNEQQKMYKCTIIFGKTYFNERNTELLIT